MRPVVILLTRCRRYHLHNTPIYNNDEGLEALQSAHKQALERAFGQGAPAALAPLGRIGTPLFIDATHKKVLTTSADILKHLFDTYATGNGEVSFMLAPSCKNEI